MRRRRFSTRTPFGDSFLLVRQLLSHGTQATFSNGRLIKIAVTGLHREFKLYDRAGQIAQPRVVLGLVLVRERLLAERGVGLGREQVQRAVQVIVLRNLFTRR